MAVANIVKTSLGPVGLDKMLVDDIGDVTITNDGATILKLLDVEHPAARLLVDLAGLQDTEVGDGTTSVVIVAAEILRAVSELVKTQKVHPTTIIQGLRIASKEAVRFISENLVTKVGDLDDESLMAVAKTSLASKVIGTHDEFFADICVRAMKRVATTNRAGKPGYPIKAVNILKSHGKSIKETQFIEGFALNCTKSHQAMPSRVEGAKIALLDFNLNKFRLAMGISMEAKTAQAVEGLKDREADITKERLHLILATGANVVLTTKALDDMCAKYLVERGVMGVRRVDKSDLKRIAKATGGTIVSTLANLEGGESYEEGFLGEAAVVEHTRVADDELILIHGTKVQSCCSVILRGANSFLLEEMERSLHDALCATKRVLESRAVVPGGGCVEAAVSVHLEEFAHKLNTREQLAVAAMAEALLVIPKQLCVNAALDASELTAHLVASHAAAQAKDADDETKAKRFLGLDLLNGVLRDNLEAGVLEPVVSKVKSIKFAVEAATTILRIDDMIQMNPRQQGQSDPHGH
jgi:T-complex protein 1 subunit alpha